MIQITSFLYAIFDKCSKIYCANKVKVKISFLFFGFYKENSLEFLVIPPGVVWENEICLFVLVKKWKFKEKYKLENPFST